MTKSDDSHGTFEVDFNNFEKTRMYPPNNGKDQAMVRLTYKHVYAVNTAKLFLHKAFDKTPEPRFKKEVEDDIMRLDELKSILMTAIANPTLPFDRLGETDGPANGKS